MAKHGKLGENASRLGCSFKNSGLHNKKDDIRYDMLKIIVVIDLQET
jgi:hypothetical protein